MTLKDLPNLVTAARIALAVVVFALLAAAAGLAPVAAPPTARASVIGAALVLFVIAALTDFVDGWTRSPTRSPSSAPWWAWWPWTPRWWPGRAP